MSRRSASFIRELGHDPVPSDDGDAFGLDFAIRDDRTGFFGIGIECDAPRHELLRRARAREIWRPAVLARAIPMVIASLRMVGTIGRNRNGCACEQLSRLPFREASDERTEGRSNRHARRDRSDLQTTHRERGAGCGRARRFAKRHDSSDDALAADLDGRLGTLRRLFEAEQLDGCFRSRLPVMVTFLRPRPSKFVHVRLPRGSRATKRRRIADAARTIMSAMEASGHEPSAALKDVAAREHCDKQGLTAI